MLAVRRIGPWQLGEGLAADIVTELERVGEQEILAPDGARVYRDSALAAERIGRELGLALVHLNE